MKKTLVLLSALGATTFLPVHVGYAGADGEHNDDKQLIITAARVPQALPRVLGETEVLNRTDIEKAAATDVADLLGRLAGIDVVRSGPSGSQTSVFVRGTESDHVLVLVDGVPVNSATVGSPLWAELSPALIERIEVIKGARSAVYGSDAIGAVIYIQTRQAEVLSLSHKQGSFNTRQTTLSAGKQGERWSGSINLDSLRTDGFSAQNSQGFAYDPDEDGNQRDSVLARLGYQHQSWTLRTQLQVSDGETEIDGFGADTSEAKQTIANIYNQWQITDDSDLSLQLGYNQQTTGTVDASRQQAEIQYTQRYANGLQWLTAIGHERLQGEDPGRFDESTNNQFVLAQLLGQQDDFDWQLAWRQDRHDAFGSHRSVSAAMGLQLHHDVRAQLSYADGFRAPTLSDLYSPPGVFGFGGNSSLNPEKARTFEYGLDWDANQHWRFSGTLFNTVIEDLIAFQGANFQAINVARADIEGFELGLQGQWRRAFIKAAYTKQQAQDDNGNDLLRRPRGKINAAFGVEYQTWSVSVDAKLASSSKDFAATLAGYQLFGLSASWQINHALSANLRVDNVRDEQYTLASGFNTPPRSSYISLKYSWD